MSSFKDETVTHHDGTVTKSKSGKGHCKRFWWVYLLVLVIVVVIVVPVILLVAVPKIAQQKINSAELHVDSIVVTKTESGSLNMAINSSITTDGSVHATIAGFEGAFLLMDVDPPLAFATIQFPAVQSDRLVLVNISQEINITDVEALTTFNGHLLGGENVNIRLTGDTSVRVSGIARDYPVTFTKDVSMVGFNGFKGVAVTNPHVNIGTQYNNFNATVNLPNPTIWTIDIGNTTFTNYFNDSSLGSAYILNVVLYPGPNEFFLWADVDQAPILAALVQKPYCETGEFTFELAGQSVLNHGQNLTYFSDALKSSNTSAVIDIGGAIKNDSGISLACSDTTAKLFKRD